MRRGLLVALALAPALAGCAAFDSGTPSRSPLAQAESTHEYPSASKPAERPSRTGASAVQVVEAFARAYINWNSATVADHLRALAAASVGQARSAMQLAAANASQDYELRRGGITNSGTVEAVTPLRGSTDRYVVVTRELTSATNTTAYQGLRPAWHVTVATVAVLAPRAWVVSGWQPES